MLQGSLDLLAVPAPKQGDLGQVLGLSEQGQRAECGVRVHATGVPTLRGLGEGRCKVSGVLHERSRVPQAGSAAKRGERVGL